MKAGDRIRALLRGGDYNAGIAEAERRMAYYRPCPGGVSQRNYAWIAVEVLQRTADVLDKDPIADPTWIDDTTMIRPDGTISGPVPITFRRNLGGGY